MIEINSPATRKVIRQVSFGRYNLSLEPLATNYEKKTGRKKTYSASRINNKIRTRNILSLYSSPLKFVSLVANESYSSPDSLVFNPTKQMQEKDMS